MNVQFRKVHCVGVGGAGVGAVARLFCSTGCQVSGSDIAEDRTLEELRQAGVRVLSGHDPAHVPEDADCVVYSPAIAPDNVELLAARSRGVPTYSLPQILGLLMQNGYGVAISGTHGKSTTVAMLGRMLEAAGLDPTVIVGATVVDWGAPVRVGRGKIVLVEACEFARSFLELAPRAAAILNIEPDHLDWYGHVDALARAYAEFAELLPPDGVLIAHGDSPLIRRLGLAEREGCELFGASSACQWRYELCAQEAGCYSFRVFRRGRFHCRVRLGVPGKHSVLNALAALALADRLGVPTRAAVAALADFSGCVRRLQFVGFRRGVALYDDYAHHPTAVAATLGTLRELAPRSRIWCVFQPHQLWRTRQLAEGFARALALADVAVILPVYPARERVPASLCVAAGQKLATLCQALGSEAVFAPDFPAAAAIVASRAAAGDTVVTMGAGDVWKVRDVLSEGIPRHRQAG